PPPIVQLIVRSPPSPTGTRSPFTPYLNNPFYFMHASLVEKDTPSSTKVYDAPSTKEKSASQLLSESRTKATTGSSVSSLYPLKDSENNGTESGFFVFPDLSVRMEGTYRLKFCLYEMTGRTRIAYLRATDFPLDDLPQIQTSAEPETEGLLVPPESSSQKRHASGTRLTNNNRVEPSSLAKRTGQDRSAEFVQTNHRTGGQDSRAWPAMGVSISGKGTADQATRMSDPRATTDDIATVGSQTRPRQPRESISSPHTSHGSVPRLPSEHGAPSSFDHPDELYECSPTNYDSAHHHPPHPDVARRFGPRPPPMYYNHPMTGDSWYDRAAPSTGPYPGDKRAWTGHHPYNYYYYYYHYPPSRHYMHARGFDPRYQAYPDLSRPRFLPLPYPPPEYIARSGMPNPYPYPPHYFPPPHYPIMHRRGPDAGGDPYSEYPYPARPPPEVGFRSSPIDGATTAAKGPAPPPAPSASGNLDQYYFPPDPYDLPLPPPPPPLQASSSRHYPQLRRPAQAPHPSHGDFPPYPYDAFESSRVPVQDEASRLGDLAPSTPSGRYDDHHPAGFPGHSIPPKEYVQGSRSSGARSPRSLPGSQMETGVATPSSQRDSISNTPLMGLSLQSPTPDHGMTSRSGSNAGTQYTSFRRGSRQSTHTEESAERESGRRIDGTLAVERNETNAMSDRTLLTFHDTSRSSMRRQYEMASSSRRQASERSENQFVRQGQDGIHRLSISNGDETSSASSAFNSLPDRWAPPESESTEMMAHQSKVPEHCPSSGIQPSDNNSDGWHHQPMTTPYYQNHTHGDNHRAHGTFPPYREHGESAE
ncbi:hypothetical protein BGZ94_003492, partial [Podila epigama]